MAQDAHPHHESVRGGLERGGWRKKAVADGGASATGVVGARTIFPDFRNATPKVR